MPERLPFFDTKIFRMPYAGWVIFACALGALAFAFTMQFGFGLEPCVLCRWQRVPYGVTAMLALASLLWRPYAWRAHILLATCAVGFFLGAALAIFHTGVELHWWMGTSGCAIQPLHSKSIEDLRTELLHTAVAHCDQISWAFLGLSMANWNIPFSLLLGAFAACASYRCGWAQKSVKKTSRTAS